MEKKKPAQLIFEEDSVIFIVTTHAASFRARLQAGDLNLDESELDSNIHLGVKDMISEEDRIYLGRTPGQVQNFFKAGNANKFLGRGLYSVPEVKMLTVDFGLTKIREAQKERTEQFIERYPEARQEQLRKHPNLEGETWPTPEEIRTYYDLKWTVLQVKPVTLKDTDTEEMRQAKERFQRELTESYETLKDEILGQSYQAILEAIDSITKKLETGAITETNFKRPRAILESYLSIASIFDAQEIQDKIKTIRDTMNVKAKDLRDKPFISKMFASKIKDLSKDLEELTGFNAEGRAKRTLDIDPEPDPIGPDFEEVPTRATA